MTGFLREKQRFHPQTHPDVAESQLCVPIRSSDTSVMRRNRENLESSFNLAENI